MTKELYADSMPTAHDSDVSRIKLFLIVQCAFLVLSTFTGGFN